MIFSVMNTRIRLLSFCLVLLALPLAAQKKKDQLQKPIAGPRATALAVLDLADYAAFSNPS